MEMKPYGQVIAVGVYEGEVGTIHEAMIEGDRNFPAK